MVCNNCPQTSLAEKKYVVDSSVGFGTGVPEVPKFPYWVLLLAAPLLLIPLVKKEK